MQVLVVLIVACDCYNDESKDWAGWKVEHAWGRRKSQIIFFLIMLMENDSLEDVLLAGG
jgi:hypothetical protein